MSIPEQGIEPTGKESPTPGITRLPLRTATLPPATRTNAYLLSGGGEQVLVDPGAAPAQGSADDVGSLEWALHLVGETGPLHWVLLTHHHRDHWTGAAAVLERTGAGLAAHPGTLEHLETDPSGRRLLKASSTLMAMADGAQLGASAAGPITWWHTPGHAADHLLGLDPEGWGIAGDLVAGVGTVVINPPDGSMSAYFATLRRLLEGECGPVGPLLPGHGPTIEDGPGRLRAYLIHRRQREEQVIRGLQALEERTVEKNFLEALVTEVYPPALAPGLIPVAARSMLAHLLKLQAEGRAVPDGGGWRLGSSH